MDIQRTLIGTAATPSIAGGVDLYQDIHFPDGWHKIIPVLAWNSNDINVLDSKIDTSASLDITLGLAGPAWGGRMFVNGTLTDSTITLNVEEDDFKAGMLLAAGLSPQLYLKIQTYTWSPHWFRRPTKDWHTMIDHQLDMSVDLVGFFYNVIVKKVLVEGLPLVAKKLAKFFPVAFITLIVDVLAEASANPSLIESNSGIIDHVNDRSLVDLAAVDWDWAGLVMSPNLIVQMDWVDIAVSLGETIGLIPPITAMGETVKIIDGLTSWARPQLTSGPAFEVKLDVHLKISGVTAFVVDGASGATTAQISTRNIRKEGGSIVADVYEGGEHVGSANRLGVEFTHRTGISFAFGWHIGIYWFKIFGHDFYGMVDPAKYLSVAEQPISKQYQYRLTNTIGDTSSANEKTLLKAWMFGN